MNWNCCDYSMLDSYCHDKVRCSCNAYDSGSADAFYVRTLYWNDSNSLLSRAHR